MHPTSRVVATAFALIAVLPLARASAAEIKLMCPAPMRTTISALVERFESQTQHKVTIVHTPLKTIIERITIIVFSAGLPPQPGDPKVAQELVAFLTSAGATRC